VLKFFGFDLELLIDEDLGCHDPLICSGRDFRGEKWLVVQVDDAADHLVWVCAPISERALQAVRSGSASARDAMRHSLTGTVEVVTVDHGHAVPDRCLCCAAIPEDLLPPVDLRVLVAA
jgi:hypothetical protein